MTLPIAVVPQRLVYGLLRVGGPRFQAPAAHTRTDPMHGTLVLWAASKESNVGDKAEQTPLATKLYDA